MRVSPKQFVTTRGFFFTADRAIVPDLKKRAREACVEAGAWLASIGNLLMREVFQNRERGRYSRTENEGGIPEQRTREVFQNRERGRYSRTENEGGIPGQGTWVRSESHAEMKMCFLMMGKWERGEKESLDILEGLRLLNDRRHNGDRILQVRKEFATSSGQIYSKLLGSIQNVDWQS
ncbi:hypothetical protein M440DRAFT_132963 [Trichoderma longibrachiatum ATCC 18648]|uniref:Uncharacterized protein n=1 Tax=Trichoderma longibrachiatum ATCC 18648 TaxID=983965 RepID=A0A2T4BW22_TRILO|nr:hypothetical protein M440DRAFT_132963 [Trichoderma longibrachiatum ATCC 18648]